jgi:hypothetical protein
MSSSEFYIRPEMSQRLIHQRDDGGWKSFVQRCAASAA